MNDCEKNHVQCQNGGFCLDLIDDFRCVCVNHFTGITCDRIDESVCDHVPHHLWTYNDSNCARICVCVDSHVICTCEETEHVLVNNKCSEDKHVIIEHEIRLTFDTKQTKNICNTLQTIHALTSKARDFCCHVLSDNEHVVIVSSRDVQLFQNHVTPAFFPHLRHVLRSEQRNRNSFIESNYRHVISVFFCVLFLFILIFFLIIFIQKKRKNNSLFLRTNELQVIQNNLKATKAVQNSQTNSKTNVLIKIT